MKTIVDPTGIFDASPRRAAYIVAADQMDQLARLRETQEVLTGYMKSKLFLDALNPKITSNPVQLAQMISAFNGLLDLVRQLQLAIFAFGLLTTDDEEEMEFLSSKLDK